MRRLWSICIGLILLVPSVSQAEGKDNLWTAVIHAIVEQRWDDAERLFKAGIAQNRSEAENFFWRERVDTAFREKMALNLGDYYGRQHRHEKAMTFYAELVKLDSRNPDYLSLLAEQQVCCGKEKEALENYEKILILEPDHLTANIYIGNYYFFYAEKSKKRLDEDFAALVSPTRMQYAAYRNRLSDLLKTGYGRSRQYFEKVMAQFPSTQIMKTLERIKQVEAEIAK